MKKTSRLIGDGNEGTYKGTAGHGEDGAHHSEHSKSGKKDGKGHGFSHQAHQGRIWHDDMTSLIDGHGGKDPHAHKTHHEMNKAHGTGHGLSAKGDYDGGGEECNDGLGGMGENYEHLD